MIKPQNLGCPYCGEMFAEKMGTVGYGQSETTAVTGYVCDNTDCEAEWNEKGYAILAPRAQFDDD